MPELAVSLVPALPLVSLEDLQLVLGLITAPFVVTQSMAQQQGASFHGSGPAAGSGQALIV